MENVNIFTQEKYEKVDYNFGDDINNLLLNKFITKLCFDAIVKEPCIWPSFGLVTFNSSGFHNDMDYYLLVKSGKSIVPYFYLCFEIGCNSSYSKGIIIVNELEILMKKINGVQLHLEI
ncbi:triphosphoribosyl-dephospho-CoA synthase [Clostridium sp. YIM B02555]|uniref:triphosphoribosyl-dephospho-CoA synthase n=1 Tax=Clostridium sp. YIM B02555 TaxID=2911968 RepID=UPI001EEF43E8